MAKNGNSNDKYGSNGTSEFGENPTKYSAGNEGAPKKAKIIMGGTVESHELQHCEYNDGGI